ncbi:MAG: hypothetical protein ABIG96_00525 [Candidatus Micrarchaeota archaeon]
MWKKRTLEQGDPEFEHPRDFDHLMRIATKRGDEILQAWAHIADLKKTPGLEAMMGEIGAHLRSDNPDPIKLTELQEKIFQMRALRSPSGSELTGLAIKQNVTEQADREFLASTAVQSLDDLYALLFLKKIQASKKRHD